MQKEISKEDVNKLDLSRYEGPIHVVTTPGDVSDAAKVISQEKLLGLDTEKRPTFRKGQINKVALLQIATSNEVYIFKLKKTGLPKCLLEILEDKSILKVGAAIHDDIIELQEICNFNPESFIDLNKHYEAAGFKSFGLRKLTALILGFRISKSQQTSNWEAANLSNAQLTYAATDAWVCREMFFKTEYN